MRFKAAATLAALALLTLASAHARVQTQQQQQEQNDESVVDDFVTKRGFIIEVEKPKAKPTARTRRKAAVPKKPARPGGATPDGGADDVAGRKAQPAPNGDGSDSAVADDGVPIIKASTLPALGLGYSVYMRDPETGALLPAPAGKTYRKDDSIFMVIEPSADAYLYVFNAPDGKNPVMIYPHPLLRGGENDVRAHIRETYPEDPRHSFAFDEQPGNEHLYIVLSREPIAGVPTGAALKKFCGKNAEECEWRPTAAQWSRIYAASLDRDVRGWRQLAQAGAQPVMPETLQRGIRVKTDAPKPMTVRVNKSSDASLIVTKIELMHK